MILRVPQPFPDQVNFLFRGGDTFFAFLLESVQHVDDFREPDSVNSAICVCPIIIHQLKNATSQTTEWLGDHRFQTALSRIKSKSHDVLNIGGESIKILWG